MQDEASEPLLERQNYNGSPYTFSALVRKVRADVAFGGTIKKKEDNNLNVQVDPSEVAKEDEDAGLRRVLSVWELIAYGVASTVGGKNWEGVVTQNYQLEFL